MKNVMYIHLGKIFFFFFFYLTPNFFFRIVLWEVYQQERVFKDYPNLPSLMHAVIDEGVRPEITKNCPSRLRKLMERCWNEDPKKRPSMSKVVTELENVILDVSIQDHTARKMWREKVIFLFFFFFIFLFILFYIFIFKNFIYFLF